MVHHVNTAPKLTLGEAARRAECSPAWISHLERTGQLSAERTGGVRAMRLFDAREIDALRLARALRRGEAVS